MNPYRFPAAALAAALCFSVPGLPAGPGPVAAQDVARIVSGGMRPGWRTEAGTHVAALHLHLAENWKTYWRAPGDGGIPPRFDWSGSENLGAMTLHWPRPVAFDQGGLRSIGYRDELVLPMEFEIIDPAAPARLSGTMELGVCETICIPVTLRLSAELSVTGRNDPVIRAALAEVPGPARALGLTGVDCAVEPIRDGVRLTAELQMPSLGAQEVVVFELPDAEVWISESRSERQGDRLRAAADMVPPGGAPFAVDRSQLRITVIAEDRAAEHQGC